MGTSKKTYLQDQIRLITLASYDLFTQEEFDEYMKIVEAKNQLDLLDAEKAPREQKQPWIEKKNAAKNKLNKLVAKHEGKPRVVRLDSVVYVEKGEVTPPGVTFKNLKFSKIITEFCSEMSRAMGLKNKDFTLDKVIVRWRSADVLRQLVMDGFIIPILHEDGRVENRHYRCLTASAGQLRRDKCIFMSDKIWKEIHKRLECGLSWDVVNAKGGINVN